MDECNECTQQEYNGVMTIESTQQLEFAEESDDSCEKAKVLSSIKAQIKAMQGISVV
jgi:hypothetical protein